ncbi:MAG: hypothetical protein AAF988_01040 [Pseudomonadota bacterium]
MSNPGERLQTGELYTVADPVLFQTFISAGQRILKEGDQLRCETRSSGQITYLSRIFDGRSGGPVHTIELTGASTGKTPKEIGLTSKTDYESASSPDVTGEEKQTFTAERQDKAGLKRSILKARVYAKSQREPEEREEMEAEEAALRAVFKPGPIARARRAIRSTFGL